VVHPEWCLRTILDGKGNRGGGYRRVRPIPKLRRLGIKQGRVKEIALMKATAV